MMFKKGTLILLLAFTSVISFAGIQDSIGVAKLNNKLHIQYLISPGETIYGISTKYGVSLTDLFELNPEIENGLKVGQVINIPYNPSAMAKPARTAPSNAKVYKVQPGDTYYGIAKKYNTSVEQLLKMNNMDLKAGQEIVIGYDNSTVNSNATTTKPAVTNTNTDTKAANTNPTNTSTTETKVPITNSPVVSTNQPVLSTVGSFAPPFNDLGTPYTYDSSRKQILVVPFDPYLYFSDADDEIAAKSNMQRTKVREVFRRRLNTLLIAPGYETIHLLGGKNNDSLTDLNKIYSSVSYNYQATLNNPNSIESQSAQASAASSNTNPKKGNWIKNSVGTITGTNNDVPSQYSTPADNGKYFGVAVRNPDFFNYFDEKYSIDYYVFINQFEVKTNYQNCLDRAALNYERTFIVHYSIFDANGKQIAGDKFKVHYNSNNCYVYQIVSDNIPKMAQKILNQLPPPSAK